MFKFIAAGCVVALVSLGSAAHAVQLSYGTYFKAIHNIIKDGVKPYFDNITEKTNGEITFKYLTDSTVVGATTTGKGVQQGLVDMGTVIPIYASSMLPKSTLLTSLPLFHTDSVLETGVINELFFLHCEECQAEWRAAKILPMALYGSSPYQLQCAKPIQTIDDLKGKRIQGTGENGALVVALGGLPMGLTATELYTGMSQGTLDCVIGAVAWLDTYGLKDVVKHVIDVPLGAFRPVSQMNMNMAKWNRLTREQQQLFTSGLVKLVANSAYGYVAEHNSSRQNGITAGITFAPPFAGFHEAFAAVSAAGGQRFLELAQKRGLKDPQYLLDRYLELEQQWGEIVAKEPTQEEYEKILEERIFSKIEWPYRK